WTKEEALRIRAGRPTRRPKTILVVDDDADVRMLLTIILDASGFKVVTVEDAGDALLLVETLRPDLLLLDLMMPVRDGWDVIEAVRTNPRTCDLPIVAMSAKFGLLNTRDHGVQGYVRKPLEPMAMLDVLDEVFRQATVSTDY